MDDARYWKSPITDLPEEYESGHKIMGEEIDEEFGKVFVKRDDNEYVIIVERDDIGKKVFDKTTNEDEVTELTKIAASDLLYA